MPESLSAFCSIVSFTAAKTSRMFDVSVACVRLLPLELILEPDEAGRLTGDRGLDVLG